MVEIFFSPQHETWLSTTAIFNDNYMDFDYPVFYKFVRTS